MEEKKTLSQIYGKCQATKAWHTYDRAHISWRHKFTTKWLFYQALLSSCSCSFPSTFASSFFFLPFVVESSRVVDLYYEIISPRWMFFFFAAASSFSKYWINILLIIVKIRVCLHWGSPSRLPLRLSWMLGFLWMIFDLNIASEIFSVYKK